MQYFGFDRTLGQMRTFGFGLLEWLPTELFQNNEQGVWYDPSDISSMYQDAAMTIPVTAHGDPVGAMMDLSGNGNHATQSVSASRPTYQTDGFLHWLQFDGVDDNLAHPYSSGTSNLTLAASGATTTNSGRQQIIGAGAAGNKLTSLVWIRVNNADSWGTYSTTDKATGDSALNTPIVMINVGNHASEVQKLYTNGQLTASFTGIFQGDSNDRRYIGSERASSSFMQGRIYGIAGLGREITESELFSLNKYLATKSGVTL